MSRGLPYVGRALERFEDERLLRGEGCFVDDMQLPGMCHAVVVRSAVAHGRLLGIDASAALDVPGVLAVLTHADIAAWCAEIPVRVGPVPGFEHFLQLPIAVDVVRYVGEPLAVVIAENRYVAEDGADLVYADIEPLEVVADMDRALHGEVFVHAHRGSNVVAHYEVGRGDADAAFAAADYVRKERFHCHRHSSVPLETRGLLAHWDTDKEHLSVWGAAKVPFYNRRLLAQMMGLAQERIDQIEIDVGGSFGSRGEFYPEDLLIPAAARLVGRPVKWIEDRRENLIAMNHSRDIDCELEIAATSAGRILGLRARMRTDIGAYARTTGGIVSAKAASFLPGPYDIANFHCEVHALVTNKTPSGTYRGPGRYEANFFRERLMDMMAQDLGLDPAAMRALNLVRRDQMPYSMGKLVPYEGATQYDTGDYPAVFRQALDKIDYPALAGLRGREVDGRYHGIGMACFVDSSGAGPAEYARLVVRSAGEFDLYSGASSSGQGHETTFAQILADELGVAAQQVRVHHGSTTGLARGFGTYHGRGLVMGGSAVKRVGEAFVAQLLQEAARRHDCAPAELRYECGAVVHGVTQQPVLGIGQLCEEAAQGSATARQLLEVDAGFEQKVVTFEYGSQVAHVAIDPMTWELEVLRLVTVEDCGTAINPLIVHGQVIGASVQGLGGALLEEFVYDDQGQMLCGSFADYLLPTSTDFPCVEAYNADMAPSLLNPLGAKGVGEGGIEGAGAAVANAVADALRSFGVKVVALPLSPNRIAGLVRDAQRRPGSKG